MAAALLQRLSAFFGDSSSPSDDTLEIEALPGLITLLDVALYRANEGELTATVTSANSLLEAWLALKKQAIRLLRIDADQVFARQCLDAVSDVVKKLTREPLAEAANLPEAPYVESTSRPQPGSLLDGVQQSARDTGRRGDIPKRGKDCWEAERLFCPDFVWADEAADHSQRVLRHLLKNSFVTSFLHNSEKSLTRFALDPYEQEASVLMLVLTVDLPARLAQFRASIASDSVVSKRLYLVKSEYRAPFRAFLDSHQSLQRAPSPELVKEYMNLPKQKVAQRRDACKDRLQKLLSTPELVEALALEQKCEEFEGSMAEALYSFSELARYLDQKKARVASVPNVVKESDNESLTETLRRLKGILCRKSTQDSSTGIRPILLDLQGVPRDEEAKGDSYFTGETDLSARLYKFAAQLRTLGVLCQTKKAFRAEKKSVIDVPSSISRGCVGFDHELFCCQFEDWLAMVERQHELTSQSNFDALGEKIRRAEMHTSLAVATTQSLSVVLERLEAIASDREKRLQVLQEMVENLCLREMNLCVKVTGPDKQRVLSLHPTSAPGIFGIALQFARERLSLG